MAMVVFASLFRELAVRETRVVTVFDPLPPSYPRHLPADEYGLLELYCDEPGCNCRRVMINVLARRGNRHLATINHAFEKPGPDDPVLDQTFLDPLNRQSRWSPALLDLFVNLVLRDDAYRRRLERHYELFK